MKIILTDEDEVELHMRNDRLESTGDVVLRICVGDESVHEVLLPLDELAAAIDTFVAIAREKEYKKENEV